MNDDRESLLNFKGVARLFPLPGLVFYPQAIQPLHIFEPRYRQMSADALDSDRLIALALLQPGWENDYDQRPAVFPVACLGRIVAEQLLPDGRYNMMLRGLARVRILREPDTEKLYRLANVEIIEDAGNEDIDELMALRTELSEFILPNISASTVRDRLSEFFHGELPLGQLCDLLAFALPLPLEAKQALLEETDVTARARRLLQAFQALISTHRPKSEPPSGRRFPPDFSAN